MAMEKRDPVTGRTTTGHEWNGIEELDTPVPRIVYGGERRERRRGIEAIPWADIQVAGW